MNRKQRRSSGLISKPKVYNFTEEQLKIYCEKHCKETIDAERDRIFTEAFGLMLMLPMEVLMDHYWQKSYETKIPKFVSQVLEYYNMFENNELDMEEIKKDLWEYGRVRLEVTHEQ